MKADGPLSRLMLGRSSVLSVLSCGGPATPPEPPAPAIAGGRAAPLAPAAPPTPGALPPGPPQVLSMPLALMSIWVAGLAKGDTLAALAGGCSRSCSCIDRPCFWPASAAAAPPGGRNSCGAG
jgi:hypothetical protein